MSALFVRIALLGALAVTFGCASGDKGSDDAAVEDDAAPAIDAGAATPDAMPAPDAEPGAPDAALARSQPQITGGAGKLTGTTYRMDVQVGHGFSQAKASGSTDTMEGAAPVKQ